MRPGGAFSFGDPAPDGTNEIGSRTVSIGGKPSGTADLDELTSRTRLREMHLNGSAIVQPEVTDDLGYAAAPARFCQIKRPIDC